MDVHKRLRRIGLGILWVALVANLAHAEVDAQTQIERDLGRFIRARTQGLSPTIDVPSLTNFSVDRQRFSGPLRTELSTRAREPLHGRVPIVVALYAGDELVKRGVVSPYVRVVERVVVPTRDLRPGSVISRGDLVYVERDASRLPGDVVRDLESMVGKQVRRSLRKDHVFRPSQITRVTLVERGDRVMLVLNAGALQVHAAGRAEEKGSLGEWIRVVNIDSKRELSGRVDEEGRVHVAY